MNLFDSLALSDVVELTLLCAVIFIPAGFLLSLNSYRLRLIVKALLGLRSNLRDEGSFADFIKKSSEGTGR